MHIPLSRGVMCVLLSLAFSTSSGQEPSFRVAGTSVISKDDGLIAETHKYYQREETTLFSLVTVTADLGAWALQVLVPAADKPPGYADLTGLPLEEYASWTKAKVVLSGGYFSSYSPPRALGLVYKEGKVISKLHHSWLTNAVLCIDDRNNANIVYINEHQAPAPNSNCLQAGPMLVFDRKVAFTTEEATSSVGKSLMSGLQEQSFICISDHGQVVMGVSEATSLELLEQILAGEREKGGLSCKAAMRLTGSVSAGLYIDGKLHVGNGDILLPDALSLSRRESRAR